VSGPLAETFDNTDRSNRGRLIRRVLIALAIVALILAALVALHEITGWAGPWGSIEWLHSHSPVGGMDGEPMSLHVLARWCWGK
jgi:hypothetical protein